MLEQGYWMHSNNPVVLVLSGGASKRFGTAKALAKYDGETFLDIIVSKCLSLNLSVYVVLNPDLDRILDKKRSYTTVLGDSSFDMYDSIIRGIKAVEQFSHLIIWPVDHPLVKESTLREIIKKKNTKKFVIPSCNRKLGHPIIFPKLALRYLAYSSNLREIRNQCGCLIINVNDQGVLQNINRKEDLPTYE